MRVYYLVAMRRNDNQGDIRCVGRLQHQRHFEGDRVRDRDPVVSRTRCRDTLPGVGLGNCVQSCSFCFFTSKTEIYQTHKKRTTVAKAYVGDSCVIQKDSDRMFCTRRVRSCTCKVCRGEDCHQIRHKS